MCIAVVPITCPRIEVMTSWVTRHPRFGIAVRRTDLADVHAGWRAHATRVARDNH